MRVWSISDGTDPEVFAARGETGEAGAAATAGDQGEAAPAAAQAEAEPAAATGSDAQPGVQTVA